ncbi:MAG: RNA polymerase sigma factor [Patescibacteria group bacterium]
MQNTAYQETALIIDLKLGLPEAVEIWYRKYTPIIQKFISLKIDNKKDVEEISRETFLNSLRDLPLFQGKSSLKTWMLRIAAHEVADYYRRRYAKKFVHSIPLSNFLFHEDPKNMHDTSEYVVEVLKRMKIEYKQLIILKYVENLSVKEIATRIHKSIKSVESDLFRARKEFRVLYQTVSSEVV